MLDVRDSVGSKVAALYRRSEARDYMDVAEIVLDGRWSPDEIVEMGISNDPGLDKQMLATVLHPQNSRFPGTEDFQSMGFDRSSELPMRDALTVLRYAAQGEHVDLEAVEASRVAMPGRRRSLREQLARPSSHATPGPRCPAQREERTADLNAETERRPSSGQRVAYVRVSTAGQNLDRQLATVGECDQVFTEKQSGKNTANRPSCRR